ncbi:MAG TPA: hypothetical protein VHN99_06230 [Deinococcales bacterium]|nr:hypothetical protein [Deinococcales bacterium]
MDLTFTSLEYKSTRHRILEGWLDAIYPERHEVRGHFTVALKDRLNTLNGEILIHLPKNTLTVSYLRATETDIPGTRRVRFLANYDPTRPVPEVEPNPNQTREASAPTRGAGRREP